MNKRKKSREEFVIAEDGCLNYVGGWGKDEAVQYFNRMMELGVKIDAEDGVDALKESGVGIDAEQVLRRIDVAYERKNPIYGELMFAIVCDAGQNTGRFETDEEFIDRAGVTVKKKKKDGARDV